MLLLSEFNVNNTRKLLLLCLQGKNIVPHMVLLL